MKYKTKIFLSLTLIAFSISTVYAGDYIFTGTTTLSNKIVNNNVTNPAFKVERSIGRYFNTYIMNARNITGQNASGGIRAFVTVKRKNNLVWTFTEEQQAGIYKGTSIYHFWNTQQAGEKITSVSWQNRTGNTSFTADFKIEQL